ncbi:glycosyltransferase family 2 protein [Pengzhenrongella phosphoraccumulans]|uniref:glycosyltransferase family 2 protein n=1 Tax=Pengzhenrongella phosphoraccumulans TaxID=3114394 RepID=UPI00388D6919
MSPTAPRLLVVIPAWNEQDTIVDVITEVRAAVPTADVLVVNDGSSDLTSDVAAAVGAAVLDLPINLGVGGAMRAGYLFAFRRGYDRVVQLDADGQHDPSAIADLVDTLEREGADIVIGARFAGVGDYSVRGPRRWSMQLLSIALSRVAGTRLTDTTSGFKVCGRSAIRLFATNYPAEYLGDTIESLVIAARAGLVVRQVGVQMRPRAGGSPSQGPLMSAVFLVRAVLALVVALSRPNEPIPLERVPR